MEMNPDQVRELLGSISKIAQELENIDHRLVEIAQHLREQ